MIKSTVRTHARFAVIPDLHAVNYPQEMHRVDDGGATMSAETVFEVKTCIETNKIYSLRANDELR